MAESKPTSDPVQSDPRPAHTALPWMVMPSWSSVVIPASDAGKRYGGAADPDTEAERYVKAIVPVLGGSEYPQFHRSRVMPDEAIANARLIVTAVNCHADLLAALKALRDACVCADSIEELPPEVDGSLIDAATAAIAKAEAVR